MPSCTRSKFSSLCPIPGISDHDTVVSDYDTKAHTTQAHQRKIYRFGKANWDQIKKDLKAESDAIIHDYNSGSSAPNLWNRFKESLQSNIDKNIPSSPAKRHCSLPWLSPSLRRMLRQKQRLFQRVKHSGNWDTYRDFQRTCRRAMMNRISSVGKFKKD